MRQTKRKLVNGAISYENLAAPYPLSHPPSSMRRRSEAKRRIQHRSNGKGASATQDMADLICFLRIEISRATTTTTREEEKSQKHWPNEIEYEFHLLRHGAPFLLFFLPFHYPIECVPNILCKWCLREWSSIIIPPALGACGWCVFAYVPADCRRVNVIRRRTWFVCLKSMRVLNSTPSCGGWGLGVAHKVSYRNLCTQKSDESYWSLQFTFCSHSIPKMLLVCGHVYAVCVCCVLLLFIAITLLYFNGP